MPTLKCALPVLPLLLLIASVALGSSFSGRVVGVADGDTVTVLRGGEEVRIRLYGIDAPEKRQAFGQRAKQYASDLAFGREVTVEEMGHDRYGRTVGWVLLPDGRSLNKEMVRAGLAWWYRQYAKRNRELERWEAEAREGRRGLWSDPDLVPPWEFRKQKRGPQRSRPEALKEWFSDRE